MTNMNFANMANMNFAIMTNNMNFAITTLNPEGVVGDAVATNFHQRTLTKRSIIMCWKRSF